MKIQEFELLDNAIKENLLFSKGRFLMNFERGNFKCDIYELFNFYVSVYYEMKNNKKAEIESAVYPDGLTYIAKLRTN